MNSLKKKRRFKLPHALTLLFIIAVFFGILSLIFSWAGVTLNDEAKTPILGSGIVDWFTAIPLGMVKGIWIIIFLFALGGWINVLVKSQALEAVIGRVSKLFHKDFKKIDKTLYAQSKITYYKELMKEGIRQTWIIIPLMFFFSFCGMSYGMAEESIAFYAIVIPLALAAGFDVWTGFLIIFIGAGAGVMGSIVNPFSVGAAVSAVNEEEAIISGTTEKFVTNLSDGMAWRVVGWLVFTTFVTVFTMVYAAKVKINKENSKTKSLFTMHKEMFSVKTGDAIPVLTQRRKITAIIFFMTFIIMILGMLQWDGLVSNGKHTYAGGDMWNLDADYGFNNNKATSWIHNSAITGHTDSSFETAWTFGGWYMGTLAAYFVIVSLIMAIINKTSESKYIETMVDGAKDMMGVSLAIGIAAAIPVLLKKTNMQTLFANWLSSGLKSVKGGKSILTPVLSYILFIPLTFVIPSTSGLANATFPTIGTSFAELGTEGKGLISGTITSYAWGAGLANLIVPTYGVVIGALAVTKIPYDKFVKWIIKPVFILFLLGLIMTILGGSIAMAQEGTEGTKIF